MMENPSQRTAAEPLGRGGRDSQIDQECFFEGTFRTPGNMRIEGTYQGVIECRGTLHIAETGNVNARLLVGNLTVAGQLTGEAQCTNRLEILKSGRISGSVAAQSVVVHEGAFFEGDMRMGDGAPVEAEPQARAAARATAPTPRRRAAEPATPEPEATVEPESAPAEVAATTEPPTNNGRSSASRDVIPNRTGEEA